MLPLEIPLLPGRGWSAQSRATPRQIVLYTESLQAETQLQSILGLQSEWQCHVAHSFQEIELCFDEAAVQPDVVLIDLDAIADHLEYDQEQDKLKKNSSSAQSDQLQSLIAQQELPVFLFLQEPVETDLKMPAWDGVVVNQFILSEVSRETLVHILELAVEQDQLEATLQERNEELELILHSIPAVIWSTDLELRIVDIIGHPATDFLETLHGTNHKLSLFQGMHVTRLLQDIHDATKLLQAHQQALNGKSRHFQCVHAGQGFEVQVAPLYRHNSKIIGTVAMAMEVTDRLSLEDELSAARQVQRSLLPDRAPHIPGYDLAGATMPAHNTGGDWYDFIETDDQEVMCVVGDVSGHSLPATILAAAAASMIHGLTMQGINLSRLIQEANHLLGKQTRPVDFVVLQMLRINQRTETLEFVGAGDHGMILDSQGQLKQKLPVTSPPLGTMMNSEIQFQSHYQFRLEQGQIALLLTDGFREARRNSSNEVYSEDRIIEVVSFCRGKPAAEILHAIYKDVCRFTEVDQQADDMTGIVIKKL